MQKEIKEMLIIDTEGRMDQKKQAPSQNRVANLSIDEISISPETSFITIGDENNRNSQNDMDKSKESNKREVVIVGTMSATTRAALILQAQTIDKNIVITAIDDAKELKDINPPPELKVFHESHYIKTQEPQKTLTNRKARRAEKSKKKFQKINPGRQY